MSVSSVTVGGKIKFKLVLLGNQHVGKSAIIDRFINDRFDEAYHVLLIFDRSGYNWHRFFGEKYSA